MDPQSERFDLKEIKIEVTHDCLLNCNHCSSVAISNSGRRMGWNSCERILCDAEKLGVKEIAFSGGEPLLWDHLQKAVSRSTELSMSSYLYTSGNVPDAENLISSLKSEGLSKAMFSVFGSNSTIHEKVTNQKGSYKKTIGVARYSSEVGIETEIHFVPFSDTFNELKNVVEIANKIGIKRVSVLRLVPQGRGSEDREKSLNHIQNYELIKIIQRLRKDGYDIRLGSPYNFLMLSRNPQCKSGIDRLTIGPDLKIFPCDAFKHIGPESLGVKCEYSSLDSYSLVECWEKSQYLKTVRTYLMSAVPKVCYRCIKLPDCQSGCLAQKFYKYGKLLKAPDPMCLMNQKRNGEFYSQPNL